MIGCRSLEQLRHPVGFVNHAAPPWFPGRRRRVWVRGRDQNTVINIMRLAPSKTIWISSLILPLDSRSEGQRSLPLQKYTHH